MREEDSGSELGHCEGHLQFANELPLNKRSVLKVVAKLYDPLGFISPLFITVKDLFQDSCKLKIGCRLAGTNLSMKNWPSGTQVGYLIC